MYLQEIRYFFIMVRIHPYVDLCCEAADTSLSVGKLLAVKILYWFHEYYLLLLSKCATNLSHHKFTEVRDS